MEFTDSLANKRKVFVVKIDVANGEIYLPVKKKTTTRYKKIRFFRQAAICWCKKISSIIQRHTAK